MAVITKSWTDIADTAIDPDSPVDQALMTAIRDNIIYVKEWLGEGYTAGAVQDHNHDGVNSAAIESGPIVPKNASVESGLSGITFSDYTGGSSALETTNVRHGAQAFAITSTVLANGGSVALWDDFIAVAEGDRLQWRMWRYASGVNISSKIEIVWYEKDKTTVVSTELGQQDTNTPTAYALADGVTAAAPANARWAKLQFTGGVPGVGSATGTIYGDGFAMLDLVRIQEYCIAPAAVNRATLKTATVSLAGTLPAGGTVVGITLNAYPFFPMIHARSGSGSIVSLRGHLTDGANPDSPRFSLSQTDKSNGSYDVDYRYIQA